MGDKRRGCAYKARNKKRVWQRNEKCEGHSNKSMHSTVKKMLETVQISVESAILKRN